MKIKTTMRDHLDLSERTPTKRQKKQLFGRMQRKWNPCTLLMGMYISIVTMETCIVVPQKKTKSTS
jgi:hypothetical protein